MAQPTDPLLAGRVAVVTGGNTGIGLVTARELAKLGAHVFIACRSNERASSALEQIRNALQAASPQPAGRVEALSLDLGDFGSVKRGAETFLARDLPLHLLINNAGLAGARGLCASGFELAFGVNHMGHFLLTELLLDRLRRSAPARIVTVASRAHRRVRNLDWNALRAATKTRSALHEYGVSKLANVLFSAELGRRLAGSGVTTYSLHPGVVASEVWRAVPWPVQPVIKLFMLSTEEGARTTLHCATAAELAAQTGLYYDQCRVARPAGLALDAALASELWQRSETWVASALASAGGANGGRHPPGARAV
jgi:NAD(P)-dependent dehydrogenase (short-subunit alcohol dehydrogenase family)